MSPEDRTASLFAHGRGPSYAVVHEWASHVVNSIVDVAPSNIGAVLDMARGLGVDTNTRYAIKYTTPKITANGLVHLAMLAEHSPALEDHLISRVLPLSTAFAAAGMSPVERGHQAIPNKSGPSHSFASQLICSRKPKLATAWMAHGLCEGWLNVQDLMTAPSTGASNEIKSFVAALGARHRISALREGKAGLPQATP